MLAFYSLTAWPLIRDVFFYAISLALLVGFFLDNKIHWYEALILFLWYFAYVGFMKINEKAEDKLRALFKLPPAVCKILAWKLARRPSFYRVLFQDREGMERGNPLRSTVYRKGLFHLMNETINPGIISKPFFVFFILHKTADLLLFYFYYLDGLFFPFFILVIFFRFFSLCSFYFIF